MKISAPSLEKIRKRRKKDDEKRYEEELNVIGIVGTEVVEKI
jgi:hypothetical protein